MDSGEGEYAHGMTKAKAHPRACDDADEEAKDSDHEQVVRHW